LHGGVKAGYGHNRDLDPVAITDAGEELLRPDCGPLPVGCQQYLHLVFLSIEPVVAASTGAVLERERRISSSGVDITKTPHSLHIFVFE
jgi:hypothetical protein